MQLFELTLPSLAENLALDEALLLFAEANDREVLRLWDWRQHAVVLGAGGRWAEEVHEEACQVAGVPILRRSSGGGAVLLGPGCLLFSLVLRFERDPALGDLHASYRFILGKFERGLAGKLNGVALPAFQGTSDLAIGGRKISGNAQQRKRTHLLHHGTLLYAFDPAPLARFLKMPSRQPEYRRGRSHADFLTNVPFGVMELTEIIKDAWPTDGVLTDWPTELTKELVEKKYARAEWNRRRR